MMDMTMIHLKNTPFWNTLYESSKRPEDIMKLYYHVAALCRMGFYDMKYLESCDVNTVSEFMDSLPSMKEIDDFLVKLQKEHNPELIYL